LKEWLLIVGLLAGEPPLELSREASLTECMEAGVRWQKLAQEWKERSHLHRDTSYLLCIKSP